MQGTFHFHSTYSHDGRNTLGGKGLSFCVMTEHFEDFDDAKFHRYIEETGAVSRSSGFLLIPGIEVNLSGLDTIIFPARSYEEIARLASEGTDSQPPMFKVLAHASKYPREAIEKHLETYQIHGIEIWNQQADGSHIPRAELLQWLKTKPWRRQYRYFFGCDLHSANHTVANVLSPVTNGADTESILRALTAGDFVSQNLPAGVEYRNGAHATDFDSWLEQILQRSYYRGRVLRSVRRCLKSAYKMLPRNTQHSLNDIKNYVRNKV